MRQLKLFDAEEYTEPVWKMSRDGVAKAATTLGALLATGLETVTFGQIVRRAMDPGGAWEPNTVPDAKTREFADAVEAIRAERDRIKAWIDETGALMLCVVDSKGRSALVGGAPNGFSVRGSIAGRADLQKQEEMFLGNMKRLLRTSGAAADEIERQIDGVRGLLASAQLALPPVELETPITDYIKENAPAS